MNHACSLCGHGLVDFGRGLWAWEQGVYQYNDFVASMTETEADVFNALWETNGAFVGREDVARKVWGVQRYNIDAQRNLQVWVSRLRRKLEGSPLFIDNDHRRGYALRLRV